MQDELDHTCILTFTRSAGLPANAPATPPIAA